MRTGSHVYGSQLHVLAGTTGRHPFSETCSQYDSILLTGVTRFGVLMDVLKSANISALWAGITCILGIGSLGKARMLRKPQILRHAVLLVLFLLFLAYSCVAFETWLGVASEATPFLQETAFDGPLPLMTRQVNQTRCNMYLDQVVQSEQNLCGLVTGGYAACLTRLSDLIADIVTLFAAAV